MSFEKCLHLPNLYKDKKILPTTSKFPQLIPLHTSSHCSDFLSYLHYWPFLECHINEIIQYVPFVQGFTEIHISHSFLLLNKVHYMIIAQFFYSYVSWHLNYFQFWAIMNKITINTHTLSFLLSKHLEVEVMGHRVSLCLIL